MAHKAEDFFIFAIPTLNSMVDFYSVGVLHDIHAYMQKSKIAISSDKFGVLQARSHILEMIKENFDKYGIEYGEYIRMLWVDSDIRINETAQTLAEKFKIADEKGLNLIANYKNTWTNGGFINVLSKTNDKGTYTTLTDDELNSLQDMQELPQGWVGGLGFYYGLVPIDYRFHFERYDKGDGKVHEFGEDIAFFRDMYRRSPDYRLTYLKINLAHKKEVFI